MLPAFLLVVVALALPLLILVAGVFTVRYTPCPIFFRFFPGSGFTTWCETNQLMFPLVPSVLVGYCAFKRAAGEASSSLKDVASRIDGRIMIVRESDPDSKFVAGSDRSWDQARNRCAQLQRAVNVTFTPKKAIALDYEDISKCTQRSQHIISFATNGRLRCGGLTNICQSDIPAPHDAWPKIMVHSSRCSVYEGEADHRWLPHNIVNNVYKMLPITPEFLTDTVLYELNKSYHARNGLIYVESKPRYTGHSFSRTFAVYVRQFLNKNNLPHSKTNIPKSVLGRINELAGWTTGSKEFFDYSLDFMDFMSKRNPLDLRVLNYICWGSY